MTWIHLTGEVIAASPAHAGSGIELLAVVADEASVDRLLDNYEYVHDLRWARCRLHGWAVPLPPAAREWWEFDRAPLLPWPSPSPSVGRDVGTYYGKRSIDDNTIDIVDGAGRRRLYHAVDASPTGLAWGYGGSGPTDTARSLLLDRLGYVPQPCVVFEFRDAIVTNLPEEFVLTFEQVDDWIDSHGALFAKNPRADPIDPFAAGGRDRDWF